MSKYKNKQGCGTQQPFFIALSTLQDNTYPQSIKLKVIPKADSFTTKDFLSEVSVLSKDKVLNTDGKSTFNLQTCKAFIQKICHCEYVHWCNYM